MMYKSNDYKGIEINLFPVYNFSMNVLGNRPYRVYRIKRLSQKEKIATPKNKSV